MTSARSASASTSCCFSGVLYHLRHPLLALDLIREHVVGDLFVCQSMQRGDPGEEPIEEDYPFAETAIFERPTYPHMSFIEHRYAGDDTNWWVPNRACTKAMLRSAGFRHRQQSGGGSLCLPAGPLPYGSGAVYPALPPREREGGCGMIEAAMIWNEPNNKSHWDPELDPDWSRFARMCRLAGEAIAAEAPGLPRVLGGISPIDPNFIANMQAQGALDALDVVAVHGFPLDWNLWPIDDWPEKLAEIAAVTDLPVWVSEVGASSFGAEEVQEFGLHAHRRAADRPGAAHPLVQPVRPAAGLAGDDPSQGGRGLVLLSAFLHGPAARGRHAEARRRAVSRTTRRSSASANGFISRTTGSTTRCCWLKRLGVRYLRTGLSWADSFRPECRCVVRPA